MRGIMFHVCYVAFLLHQCLGRIVNKAPVAQNATCLDVNPTCDFLNMTYSICNNTQLAREHCQLFCKLCDAVDGHWSVWEQWSECDVTCENGTRSRDRSCDNPAPSHGGFDCVGSTNEQNICVMETCPVHGGWSGWTDWGSCSASCGVGLERRDRSCVNSWPSQDGNHCKGDHSDYRVCADALCTDGWDDWSDWSSCSVTCGPGMKHRNRTCNNTAASVIGGGCVGDSEKYTDCHTKSCDTRTVVIFYAHYPSDRSFYTNETIVYGTVTSNKGGGYNSSTGVFTAPREGLYLFTSQVCVYSGKYAYTGITKEGTVVQRSVLKITGVETCNSMQAAIELRVGERVWVQSTAGISTLYRDDYYRTSSFSGMLIQ